MTEKLSFNLRKMLSFIYRTLATKSLFYANKTIHSSKLIDYDMANVRTMFEYLLDHSEVKTFDRSYLESLSRITTTLSSCSPSPGDVEGCKLYSAFILSAYLLAAKFELRKELGEKIIMIINDIGSYTPICIFTVRHEIYNRRKIKESNN